MTNTAIVAVHQGDLTVPLFDTGIRPTANWMDSCIWQPTFPQINQTELARQWSGLTNRIFFTKVRLESPYGFTYSQDFNGGMTQINDAPTEGSNFGGLFYSHTITDVGGNLTDGKIGFSAFPWNGLFNQSTTTPIEIRMQPLISTAGQTVGRCHISLNQYSAYGCYEQSTPITFVVYNPQIHASGEHAEITVNSISGSPNNAIYNCPDFANQINYTFQSIGPSVPPTFKLCMWGNGAGQTLNYKNATIIAPIDYELSFDDPNIASVWWEGGSGVAVAITPNGFLFTTLGNNVVYKWRSIYLSRDGTKYYGINYSFPTGVGTFGWNSLSSPVSTSPIGVTGDGVIFANGWTNSNTSSIWLLTSLPLNINFKVPNFLPSVFVDLPCMSPCLGKNFALTKL